jgi:hypothetical protein
MQNMFSKLSLKMTLPQVEINCNKNYISKKWLIHLFIKLVVWNWLLLCQYIQHMLIEKIAKLFKKLQKCWTKIFQKFKKRKKSLGWLAG